ncbi:glycosyltransferase family 2 protein [Bacteriovoracales bacterium]|nr:glycosyltransferase family 2 protein [Bacteriovoracales bacterium]
MKELDIVIPVFNEESVLSILFAELEATFSKKNLLKAGLKRVNYLFVDDGSKDASSILIKKFLEESQSGKLIRLSRNFGHQNALTAGLDLSEGDFVSVIDADLQDPPKVILEMLQLLIKSQSEVVFGIRKKRKENKLKVFCYWLYYRGLAYLTDLDMPLDSGDFFVMTKKVRTSLCKLPEKLRYPRGLKTWVGFKQVGYEYERHSRAAGSSKYSFKKLYDLATNGITSLTTKPLRVTQFFTVSYSFLSIIMFIFVLIKTIRGNKENINFDLIILLILFSFSVLSFCLYIMSAYVGRTYLEVKGRPSYLVGEVIEHEN